MKCSLGIGKWFKFGAGQWGTYWGWEDYNDRIREEQENIKENTKPVPHSISPTNTKPGTSKKALPVKTKVTKETESKIPAESTFIWKHDGDRVKGKQNMRKVVNPNVKKKNGKND